MSHIVILTGAGASKPLGFPVTTEFFANTGNVVHAKLKEYLRTDTLDVEVVLELIDPIGEFSQTPSGQFLMRFLENKAVDSIVEFIQFTKRRCFEVYGTKNRPDTTDVRNLYYPLLEGVSYKNNTLDFFTTNYDPVTDVLLDVLEDEFDGSVTDGFSNTNRWNPSEYEKDFQVRFFRLHGSMSFKRQGQTIRNTWDFDLGPNIDDHLLVYPGYKGDPNGEEDIFSVPHNYLKDSLQRASLVVIIGFAFRDKFINRAVCQAARSHGSPFVLVVNPEREKVLRRNLGEQCENLVFVQQAFGADMNASEVLSLVGP